MQGLKHIIHFQHTNSFHEVVLSYICKDSGSKTNASEVSSNTSDDKSKVMSKSWVIVGIQRKS